MTSLEPIIICGAVDTGVKVVQSSGMTSALWRWFRLMNCRLVTVTRAHNHVVFRQITEILNQVSSKLKLRTAISFTDGKQSSVYFIPDRNTEVEIPTKYGSVWIKVVSLDNYEIVAYEITCDSSAPMTIDKFLFSMIMAMNPGIDDTELEELKRLLGIQSIKIETGKDILIEKKPDRGCCR
jgi:hypothetical protein